jgi:stage V sporulation protein G
MPENKNSSDKTATRDVKLDVRVYPLDNPETSTKAFASITVDDLIAIRGVRVVQGEEGLFVSMPQSRQEKDGETKFHDIAFPITRELHKQIRREVLDGYRAEMENPTDRTRGTEKSAAVEKPPRAT